MDRVGPDKGSEGVSEQGCWNRLQPPRVATVSGECGPRRSAGKKSEGEETEGGVEAQHEAEGRRMRSSRCSMGRMRIGW